MLKKVQVCLFAVVAIACFGLADAQAGGYVGASFGQGTVDAGDGFDGSDTSYKVQGGYRFVKFFGVEGDYRDLGTVDESYSDAQIGDVKVELGTKSIDVFAVGVLPIGTSNWEVFGKAGMARWDVDVQMSATQLGSQSESQTGNDFAYGVGAAYNLNKFSVRMEYEEFDVDSPASANMASVGFDFRF